MKTDLDEGELMDIREAVAAQMKELLSELAHADQRDYRAMLRAKYERLERLATRLEGSRRADAHAP